MHGETIKLVDAQQAKYYNIYKNTKLKLLKTGANSVTSVTAYVILYSYIQVHKLVQIQINSVECFDVLLTVHLSIFILVINQLNPQHLFYNKFTSCLCI